MAKSEWAVMSNYRAGVGKQYIAMRLLDTNEPMHSGNMEFYGQYSVDKQAVTLITELLNEREAAGGASPSPTEREVPDA